MSQPENNASSDRADRPLSIALMIETVGLGGAEMVVLQLAEELRARGHAVHPVVPAGAEGWLLDRFRANGFEWEVYEGRGVDWTLPRRLAEKLARLKVDVLHSHEFVMAVFGTPTAKRLGVPHVITMHGNQKMTRKWQRRAALRWAFRRSAATVGVSEDTRRHLDSALGLEPGLVQVVPNGIPERVGDGDRIRGELGLAPSELLLLSVGSLVPRKGHAVLIEALGELKDTAPWRLAIAGQGVEHDRLAEAIRNRGLDGRVHLLGPRDDVPDLQAAADIFVMPSLWEGLPLAILEAMFAGNAVIASRTSGIPEAIDDGGSGLLVDPGDVPALREALRRLLLEPELRARLGETAQERARARFSIGVMADAYERLYRLPAGRPRRSGAM